MCLKLSLPLASVLNAFADIGRAVLHTVAERAQGITDGLARAAGRAGDGLTYAARCRARDAADSPADAADCVAEGAGDELGGACDALVLGVVERHGCGGLLLGVGLGRWFRACG